MSDYQPLEKLETQAHEAMRREDFQSAQVILEQAITLARQLGVEPLRVAELLYQLGVAQRRLGNLSAAQQHLEQAIGLYRDAGDNSLFDLALALHELGRIARKHLDNDTAWAHFTEELHIWKRLRPQAPPMIIPHVASCLYACGLIMAEAGKRDLARQNFEQALELRQLTLPANHPGIAESLATLGNICLELGDFSKAQYYLKQALPLLVSGLGENNPGVKDIRQKLTQAEQAGTRD